MRKLRNRKLEEDCKRLHEGYKNYKKMRKDNEGLTVEKFNKLFNDKYNK